jgi:hypothetical protein
MNQGGLKMLRSILIAALIAVSFGAQAKTIWKDVTYQDHGNLSYGTDGSVTRSVGGTMTIITPPSRPKRYRGARVCLMYADNVVCSN